MLIKAFTPADSSILLTQRVLQPCTDKIGLSPYTVLFEAGDYKLFPNPTPGPFEVDFFVRTPGQMSLQLINVLGQILEKRSFHYDGCCRIELFDLTGYPAGVYFVVADLKPDTNRADGLEVIRHSGLPSSAASVALSGSSAELTTRPATRSCSRTITRPPVTGVRSTA